MNKVYYLILLLFPVWIVSVENALTSDAKQKELIETIEFTPPEGWQTADPKGLPKHVYAMVVGKGKKEFPPSINLGMSPYKGSLKDYLKKVKEINDSHGVEWKDLGTIRTEAGPASLSQIEMKTQWGEIKEMHLILVKNEMVYILTAAALKNEFPDFYKDFFRSMKSLHFNKSADPMTNAK